MPVPQPRPQQGDVQKQDHAIVEHVPEDAEENMEALGPAEEQQAAQLSKLHISDPHEARVDEDMMDVDSSAEKVQPSEALNRAAQEQDVEESLVEENEAPRPQKHDLQRPHGLVQMRPAR